jgi:hypothetical protein
MQIITPKVNLPPLIMGLVTVLFLFVASYVLLVLPGKVYISIWLNDIVALLDAAYRASLGGMPNVDYATPIGPLNFLVSGYIMASGAGVGTVFALQADVTFLLLCIVCLKPLSERFGSQMIVLIIFIVWLLVVAPLGMGVFYEDNSWAMYYNRFGWAALFLTFLFYVSPRSPTYTGMIFDVAALALLITFQIYTKITYGIVAFCFLIALALLGRYERKVAIISIAAIGLLAFIWEVLTQSSSGYVDSILAAIESRGAYRSNIWGTIARSLKDFELIVATFLGALYLWMRVRRTPLDLLYVSSCLAISLIMLDQNGEPSGLPSLFAPLICFIEIERRNLNSVASNLDASGKERNLTLPFLLFVALAAFVASRVISVQNYHQKITKLPSMAGAPQKLENLLVPSSSSNLVKIKAEYGLSDQVIGETRLVLKDTLSTSEYYKSIIDGAELLKNQGLNVSSVVTVLDLANPFSYIFDLKPPSGSEPFFWGRPDSLHRSPKVFFNNVDIVMIPKYPYHYSRLIQLKLIYQPYLTLNYELKTSSVYWEYWKLKGK